MPPDTLMTETATTTEGAASTPAADPATVADDGGQAQTPDPQTTEGQRAEGEPAAQTEEEPEQPEGAPETYEFKAAEGAELDPTVIEQFSTVARELDLTQDKAQLLLDKMGPVIASRQAEQIQAIQTQWANEARTDKEFGGDKLNENLATAKKALEAFGSPELRTLLNDSGLGNHPEFIRLLYRAGSKISEDQLVPGTKAAGHAPGDPKRLYPNSNMN